MIRLIWQRVRPFLPDAIDLHVYGGGVALAVGAWIAWGAADALIVAGAFLAYLGIRRM